MTDKSDLGMKHDCKYFNFGRTMPRAYGARCDVKDEFFNYSSKTGMNITCKQCEFYEKRR